jgi:thiosulfate dehydrogenase
LTLAIALTGLTAAGAATNLGQQIAEKGNGKGATPCVACHGTHGEGNPATAFPRLAGLNAEYLVGQLEAFQKNNRENTLMGPIAKALGPEEVRAVSAYYASLPPPPETKAPVDVDKKSGRDIAVYGKWVERGLPACNQCHGPGGEGVGRNFPALAGQQYDYMVKRLKAWKSGSASGDANGMMRAVAEKLTDKDIELVAAYYASPPSKRTTATAVAADQPTLTAGKSQTGQGSGIHPTHTAPLAHHGDTPAPRPAGSEGYFRSPPRSGVPEGKFGNAVRLGEAIFSKTASHPVSTPYVGNKQTCEGCHLDGGRLANSAPLWASWVAYPAFRTKNNRVNTMTERIQGCFKYSMNAQGSTAGAPPSGDSDVVMLLESYIYWLATGAPTGDRHMPGRGYQRLKETALGFDPSRGKPVYTEHCAICHGKDGDGYLTSGGQVVFPPLWGKDSYNWGAGMHKIDVAAAYIKWNMPLGMSGILTDQQAWDVAAYINSHERPQDPRHEKDLKTTRDKFHKSKFDYYGKRRGSDGRLLGQGSPGS